MLIVARPITCTHRYRPRGSSWTAWWPAACGGLRSSRPRFIRAWGAIREAVLAGVPWQRCQYHLAQNAIHFAPKLAIRKRIGEELRRIWNSPDLEGVQAKLKHHMAKHAGRQRVSG